jgi:hypothetical protein
MAASTFPPVDFTGFGSYTPVDFEFADLLTHEGLYLCKVTKVTPGRSKEGNAKITLTASVQDENKVTFDGREYSNHGKLLLSHLPYEGVTTRGKNPGQPNVLRLFRLIHKAGLAEDAKKLDGKKAAIESLIAKLEGVQLVAATRASEWEGEWRSDWSDFFSAADHNAISLQASRKALPAGAYAQLTGKQMQAANGAATSQPATQTVADVASFM